MRTHHYLNKGVAVSVIALKCILVDYGETSIASDVMEYYNKNVDKKKKGDMNRMMFYRRWFEYGSNI
jgi:hypothetical protein